MKKLAAIALTALLLTGCAAEAAPEPTPSPTSTQTFKECAKEAFEDLKKEKGTQYLIDHKDAANARVMALCKDLYKKDGK